MLTRLVVIIILAWFVYIWFEWWVVHTINHDIKTKEENYKELTDEIEWWKKQTHDTLAEVNEWKDKRAEMQHMYNKERNKVFELETKLEEKEAQLFISQTKAENLEKERTMTIAEANKKMIIKMYEDGLSQREIATLIHCNQSTIHRALKKFWLR